MIYTQRISVCDPFGISNISANLIPPACSVVSTDELKRQMDSPLMEAGMDSLSSVEFRNQAQNNKATKASYWA